MRPVVTLTLTCNENDDVEYMKVYWRHRWLSIGGSQDTIHLGQYPESLRKAAMTNESWCWPFCQLYILVMIKRMVKCRCVHKRKNMTICQLKTKTALNWKSNKIGKVKSFNFWLSTKTKLAGSVVVFSNSKTSPLHRVLLAYERACSGRSKNVEMI